MFVEREKENQEKEGGEKVVDAEGVNIKAL